MSQSSINNRLTLVDYHVFPKKVICGIYKLTDLINGSVYIGQSIDIYRRLNGHRQNAFNPNRHDYHCKLHRAIREDGLTNFHIEILREFDIDNPNNLTKILDEFEILYIKEFNSFYSGLNETLGGGGTYYHDPFSARSDQIIDDFVKGDTIYDISINHKISEPSISKILKSRGIETKPNQKRRDIQISKLYKNGLSIRKIAKKFDCSACLVQKSLERTNTQRRHHRVKTHKAYGKNMKAGIKNKIVADYLGGQSIRTIAAKHHVGRNTVAGILHEYKIMIRRCHSCNKKKVVELDCNSNIIATYPSIKEAAEAKGLKSSSSISQMCNHTYHKNQTAAGSK